MCRLGKMTEVSRHPGDAVELRKKFFERCTDRDACQAAFNELKNADFSTVWTARRCEMLR